MICAVKSVPGFADVGGPPWGWGWPQRPLEAKILKRLHGYTPLISVAMNVNSLMPVFVQEWTGMCKALVMTHQFKEPKANL